MIIDRDKHNKYVVGWKPNYTVPTNQGSSSGTNVTIVYGGGGSGSSTPVSSEAFSYYKVSDGENAITQEAKVQKDVANLSIIGDEGIKVELITDPTIFEASFTSTGTNTGVYKISYGKVTTVVEEPGTQAEEPTEPEVVITFPMTITYVSGEKIKAEQFDTLRLLNNTEEVATYPSSGLTIEGDADGILSISLEVYKEVQSVDEEGNPAQDAEGNPVMEKQGLYFNRILLTTQLEDQPSTQAEGDSTEEEPQQPTYESLLSFDVVVNIDTVIKLSVTAVSDLWKLDDNGNIYTEYNAYSLKELSAYGLGEGGSGEGVGFLHELGDVSIPDPNAIPDNAILQYNIETGKWEAVELELPEDSATREWVEQKFKDLINGAPADLDTLGEIAIAIQELQQLLDWFSFVDGRIRANYNFWGVGEVSAYGPASGSDPGTGGGAGYLHELDDVTINNDTLTDGQIIVWDEDSQMWVNTDFPGLDEDALALYLTQNKYATQEWVNGQLDSINNKLEEFQTTIDMINDMFEWDNGKIKAKATLYSVGEISAYGAGEGSSGTGGYLHELDDVLLTSLQDDQLLMYDATIEKWVNVDKDEVGLNETQLAQYLTEHGYAIMSNVVPITRRIIAGDGLQGGGPLSSDVTLSMAPLTASDIPGLDWSKIISGKPTTLAGYGITDGVNTVSVTGTGNAVTTASISGHTLTLTKALSFALITGTNATGTWPISITGNAATANKWTTARTITLAGAVIGSTSIDGSGNVTITTTYTTDNISALDGRYVNVTGDTMTGNLILPTLQANTSIILGSVKLEYDSASSALKISNVNTQQVINLYATGEISAYGYNSGSAGGGASALDDLNDVTLSNLQNGQALVYNSSTGQWVNTTIQAGGIDETALAQYLMNNQYLTMPTGDARYVKKSGDTMTGQLTVNYSGGANAAMVNQKGTSVYAAMIGYGNDSGTLGYIGVGGSSSSTGIQPFFTTGIDSPLYTLLHTNNYATYTVKRADALIRANLSNSGEVANKNLNYAKYNFGTTNRGDDTSQANVPTNYGVYLSLAYSDENQAGQLFFDTVPGTTGTLYFRTRNAGNSNTVNSWRSWKTLLDSTNYTNYTVTKTGGGASGTWPISISGSAAVAGYLSSMYTGSGGNQPPSYFNGMGLKVNMMAIPMQYTDVIVVNGYYGRGDDVPYINAIAFQKTSATHGEVFHASGNYGASSWKTWYKFLDEYNYASIIGNSFVKKAGDTMTGKLTISAGINQMFVLNSSYSSGEAAISYQSTISSSNAKWVVGKGSWGTGNNFTWGIDSGTGLTPGAKMQLSPSGVLSILGNTVWHAGNDGSGSGLDADLLDGLQASALYQDGYVMFSRTIDASGLDQNTWYPVTFNLNNALKNVRIECRVALDSGTKPSWSTHASGFSVRKIWEVNGAGWGTNPVNRRIFASDSAFADTDPVRGLNQNTNSSIEYVYVRGGGKYYFYVSHNIAVQLHTSSYTSNNYTIAPTTTAPAVIRRNDAYITDTVAAADRLATPRSIWGQPFDGTAPVSGNMTGVGSITGSGNISMSGSITAGAYVYSSGWFQNQQSGKGLYNNAVDARWYANSSGWVSDKKINANAGLRVPGTTTLDGAVQVPYSGSSWIGMATRTNLIYSTTNNSTSAAHALYRVKAYNGNALCFGGLENQLGFYAFTAANISSGANIVWKNTYWDMTNWTLHHNGVLHVTSGIYSDSYVSALGQNSSDKRLKTNIQDFKATTLIKQLHPKSFEWNDLAKSKFEVFRNTGTQYGLIAQDVKEVMPEWVDDNLIGSGYMGIRYDKLIPVLLQGEIETINRVETLEDKVKRLEMENSKLKAKLSKLERRIG